MAIRVKYSTIIIMNAPLLGVSFGGTLISERIACDMNCREWPLIRGARSRQFVYRGVSLDDQALGGGGVGGAEGDEVGAGGVLAEGDGSLGLLHFEGEEFAACRIGEGN